MNSDYKCREKVKETDMLATAFNITALRRDRRIVDLECGHKAIVKLTATATNCPRCGEMLKRSVETGAEDYESFRKGHVRDQMDWPDDPCRLFNEPEYLREMNAAEDGPTPV